MLDNRKIKGVGFIYTVCCVASVVYAKDAPKERPNFVWFMAEDVSKHYLNLYNNGKEGVITPNIEKLAAEGIVFNNACIPLPTALLMSGVRTIKNKIR